MILLTVGTQLPFDRLVKAVDEWCAATGRKDVFGQIGSIGPHSYRPKHFEWRAFVSPAEFNGMVKEADLLVAHAGMGSLIAALTQAKPIVIMPRRAALGEHRNDHQLATARHLVQRENVYLANDEFELPDRLKDALAAARSERLNPLTNAADPQFIASIRRLILESGELPVRINAHETRS